MTENFPINKILEGSPITEIQRILPYDVVFVDSDTDGSDGAVHLVARMRESFSATASVLSIIGGGPSLNWRGK